ncbi:MAG TPA: hypothetical protein DDZ51_16615 [Planctomycetaceae bacterium]|nr:hypothetical protein [Planctomycetaceae bacterium]
MERKKLCSVTETPRGRPSMHFTLPVRSGIAESIGSAVTFYGGCLRASLTAEKNPVCRIQPSLFRIVRYSPIAKSFGRS